MLETIIIVIMHAFCHSDALTLGIVHIILSPSSNANEYSGLISYYMCNVITCKDYNKTYTGISIFLDFRHLS